MRAEPATMPPPKSMKQWIAEMDVGAVIILYETTHGSVLTTMQRVRRGTAKRFQARVGDDGGIVVWRLEDSPQ